MLTYSSRLTDSPRVLRSDDPDGHELIKAGWVIGSTSWGAWLRVDAAAVVRLERLVQEARSRGVEVRELAREQAAEITALEDVTLADYPQTHATFREGRNEAGVMALFDEAPVFGVRAGGHLVAVTATVARGELVETKFTSVPPDHRRTGLATATKAASVLAYVAEGRKWFGTGGAGTNRGSIAMNEAVGYQITERWDAYLPPTTAQSGPADSKP